MSYKKYNKEGTDWEYAISPLAKALIGVAIGLFVLIIFLWIAAVVANSITIGGVGWILVIPLVATGVSGGILAWYNLGND